MKRLCIMIPAFCAVVVAADPYYLKSGATDFSIAAGYTVDEAGNIPASSVPNSTNEVIVPAGTFVINAPSASFNTLSGVKRVRPMEGAVLEFIVADANDTAIFNAPINWNADQGSYSSSTILLYGKVVKKGAGALVLESCGKTKSNGTSGNNQDYFTIIDLQAGTLKFSQHATGAMYFGDLTMAADSTLVTCGDMSNTSKGIFTYLRSLNGDGIITNETGRSSGQPISLYRRNVKQDNVFHGRICHSARIWLSGRLTQYGHDTGITQPIVVDSNAGHLNDGYDCGTYSFEDVALLGPYNNVQLYDGGIHYFGGVDATIAKNFPIYTYRDYPAFIDAGWHGGLLITGNFTVEADSADNATSKWLVLTGSNTVPCTITGGFGENRFLNKSWEAPSLFTIFTQKLGSGTWRLSGNKNHGGGFAIEEGTLQFDSIAEKGEVSSVGRSTNLTTACTSKTPEAYRADYAFSLGSTNAVAPKATFEFTGAKSCVSGTRPLVLMKHGGTIKASGTDGARLGFGGISAYDTVETTLVLDGTNEAFNVATGITDGNGTVNVVKEGVGEWYLSGTNTFTGDLHVKSGTLTVLGDKYTWFRFTVRELGDKGHSILCRQLALYDANGIRQNICLKVKAPVFSGKSGKYWVDSDWRGLAPGAFAFGANTFRLGYNSDPTVSTYVDQLFSDVGNSENSGIPRFDGETSYGKHFSSSIYHSTIDTGADSYVNPNRDSPETWMSFVMRLTNGVPEIVAYDIESMWDSNGTNCWPKVGSMEASVDGIHWDFVETNTLGEVVAEHDYDFSIPLGSGNPGNSNRWYSDGTAQINWSPTTGTTPRPGAGFKIRGRANLPPPLENVRSISVDEGAILRTDASVVLHSLKVNSAGAGTFEGFSFAQDGMLDVAFDGALPTYAVLPGTYVNCTGMENIVGWGLKVNGSISRKYRIKTVNGMIMLVPKGYVISFK